MVRGETFNLQTFESAAFRHFINVFTNKQSGVTLGCEVTKDSQNITVSPGYFFILGGLLREETGTENEIPTEAGYYKLVYEIDLSKTNQKDVFNQGSYKFIKALGDYPELIQQDLDNNGTIYQFEFCRFRITELGLEDFSDTRKFIDYGIFIKKAEVLKKEIIIESDTAEVLIDGLNINEDGGTYEIEILGSVGELGESDLVSITADINNQKSYSISRIMATQNLKGNVAGVVNNSAERLFLTRSASRNYY